MVWKSAEGSASFGLARHPNPGAIEQSKETTHTILMECGETL